MARHPLLPGAGLFLAALGILSGCGSSGAARSPEELAAARAQVLWPFQPRRQAVCDELEIDVSGGLLGEITRPARVERRPGSADLSAPDVYTVVNESGMAQPIEMAVGNLTFAVLNKAVFRVHPAQPPRMDLSARGNVDLVDASGSRARMTELNVTQGVERRSPR